MKGKKKNKTFSEDSTGVNSAEETAEKVAETIEENTPVGDEFAILDGKDAIAIQQKKPKILAISKASVIISVVVVVLLIIASIVLAYTLPLGQYERSTDADGNVYISGDYHEDPSLGRLPWWKILLSPFLVLGGSGTLTLVAILFMLVVIGAVFNALDKTDVLVYMVESIRHNYGHKRYLLLFLLPLAFMFLGTTSGMSEEVIPIVPVAVILSYGLGWDALIGLGFSVLAAGLGFMAGVVNPFNVGIAQSIVGVPMFSGIGIRILTFVLCYVILMAFMFPYARMLDKKPQRSPVYKEDLKRKENFDFENRPFVYDAGKSKALKFFAGCMIAIVFFAVLSIFLQGAYIPALGSFKLADYILYITVVIYIIGGVVACVYSGLKGKALAKEMLKGALTLLPVTGMVLIASSVRYIIEAGHVMDTILYHTINAAKGQNPAVLILIIYLVVLIFELFITSGSAKAFLLMPMIGAICSQLGINPQVAVLAFTFGDGIVNVFMPTNATLLLTLGLTTVTYPKWFRWAGPILLTVFGMTIGILMLAQFVIFA